MKALSARKPLFDKNGNELCLIKRYPGTGNLAVENPEFDRVFTVDKYGYPPYVPHGYEKKQVVFNEEPTTTEYLSLYPDGNVYKKTCCPVRTSSYDIENELIQIKVTRRGGKIIRKEFC